MQVDCFSLNYSEKWDFDVELEILWPNIQKQVVIILDPFLLFMVYFQQCKIHNMLTMIDSDFKRLGFFIQYVGNEITLQITSEYDWHVLIPLLVHVFKFLNPSVASERTFNVTLKNIEATLLYDVMEAKKEMVLSMVKKVE